MNANYYAKLPYAVEVVPDLTTDGEQIFVARHPELPGCMAHGETQADALVALADARALYLSSLIEDGIEPPRPATENGNSRPVVSWSVGIPTAGAEAQAITSFASSTAHHPSYAAVGC